MAAYHGPQKAMKEVNDRLAKIKELYAECEAIAMEHGVHFSYSGPAGYGDGGYFDPEREEDWRGDSKWLASSQSC